MPYRTHSAINSPTSNDVKTWRYMDLSQQLSILERQALYFNRVDQFDDPFEGKFPKPHYTERDEIVERYERWTKKLEDVEPMWDKSRSEEFLKQITDKPLGAGSIVFDALFLNCWHLNEKESAAMWDMYLKSDEGISIQSTFGRMKRAVRHYDEDIYIGKVQYIDYEDEWIPEGNDFYRFLHKRDSFEHEKELRMMIFQLPDGGELEFDEEVQAPGKELHWDKQPTGLYIPVDVDILIEEVYVAPTSPQWLVDLIKDILSTYEVDCEVSQSTLYEGPPAWVEK